MFLPSFLSDSKSIRNSIGQHILYTTFYSAMYRVFFFYTIISFINFELFLLVVFVPFVCSINFLGNVLFLGKMRRFGKLSSNSSSSPASEEEDSESAIEKCLRLIVPKYSNKMNDLNQTAILAASKHKFPYNNNRRAGITVSSYHVT